MARPLVEELFFAASLSQNMINKFINFDNQTNVNLVIADKYATKLFGRVVNESGFVFA